MFVPTTWRKFRLAEEINDLFAESPLEDRLWEELKQLKLNAERQWMLQVKKHHYLLDFALFCNEGCIDIEVDGDTWHAQRERIARDNRRNNDLATIGWHVLRYNGEQINQRMKKECLGEITRIIENLKGLNTEGFAPRAFIATPNGIVEQLSLFDPVPRTPLDTGEKYNVEL